MLAYSRLTLLVMLLQFAQVLTATAQQNPLTITADIRNTTLDSALKIIRDKAGISLRYNKEDLQNAKRVTIHVINWPVERVLDSIFSDRPLEYKMISNNLLVYHRSTTDKTEPESIRHSVTGKVTDANNDPIAGATISSNNRNITITNHSGIFIIPDTTGMSAIRVTCVSCEPQTVSIRNIATDIKMNRAASVMEAAITTATYVPVSKVNNTGSVTVISRNDMGQQPGRSLTDNLSGIVPGMFVKRSNGSYGATSNMQIRGETRIGLFSSTVQLPSNSPLIVVDGVPLPSTSSIITQLASIAGDPSAIGAISGLSQLRFINMDDIESIVILKDADATAIYGSRGANGVVLIETQKARSTTPSVSATVFQGIARAPFYDKLMNAAQYTAMRKEAISNDKQAITALNAPDLTTWSSTNDNDYTKLFMGGTAATTNAHTSIAGWSDILSYHLDLGYYREGSIFPGNLPGKNYFDRDVFVRGNITQQSKNKKLFASLTGMYTSGRSNSIATTNFFQARLLPPNAPALLDSNSKLIWPASIFNPYAYLLYSYRADIENTLCNLKLHYTPWNNFTIKTNVGLNLLNVDERSIFPIAAQNPATQPTGSTADASNFIKNYLFELTAEKLFKFHHWNFLLLGGTTVTKQSANSHQTQYSGFTSDVLLGIPSTAQETKSINSITDYKYAGIFGAMHIEYKNKYILNLTGRRDGSSRYGKGNRYGNFGATGFAWILSREKFLHMPAWITLAKLRTSYGITGNDQIGDYMYLDIWNQVVSQRSYGGISGFAPSGQYNNNYKWELCKKLELAIELLLDHKWSFTFSYFYNTSFNQLLSQSITTQTGFGNIRAKNTDVSILNKGIEYGIEKQSDPNKKYHWTIALTGTIPVNRLVSFPGLEQSLYANTLRTGESVSVQRGYEFKGLNQQTGLFEVKDKDNNTLYNSADYISYGDKAPKWYGSLRGSVTARNFILDFCWEFCNQQGINTLLNYMPGRYTSNGISNIPVDFLDRWQKPGDNTKFQKLSATAGTDASKAWDLARNSSLHLVDASYIRLKNICLSYTLHPSSSHDKDAFQYKLYLLAENAVTFTRYKGADPATQNPSGLPVLKRYSAGLKIIFK